MEEARKYSKGVGNFRLPTNGGMQDAYCLKLDFVPLWLAKISITPTMEQETPELAETLEKYQLKAKDVLASAFLTAKKGKSEKPTKTESQISAETKRANAMQLNAKNRTADRFQKLWDRANVKPEYQALALMELFEEDGVKLPRIALQGTKVTYDKGTIAEKLGVYSSKGEKPHAQAVGAIIAQIEISEYEREPVPFCRNGHDGTDYQYTESVIEKVRGWLEDNNYPSSIPGNGKNYGVQYKKGEQNEN